MIVLDTDIVTLLSYGKNEKLNKRFDSVLENEEFAITVITYMEVLEGRFASIKKSANADELLKAMQRFAQSRTMLGQFTLADIDKNAAWHFQEMTKAKKKSKLKRGDMLIACIALSYDAVLVTRNVSDFKYVKDLRIEDWTS